MIIAVIVFFLLFYILKALYVILQTLTKLLKWMLQNEFSYQAEKRPVAVAFVALIATASIFYVAYKNGIRSLTDLTRAVSSLIVRVYRYVLRFVVQYIADLVAGIFEYLIEFSFGVLAGIVQAWQSFKLPKIKAPELDL